MKVRKYQLTAVGLLCVMLLTGCQTEGSQDYSTVTVQRGTVEQTVEDIGTVTYREHYGVIPVVNGKIIDCAVEEGDPVTEGQLLYTIDSTSLEEQITQGKLSLKSAQTALEQAERACEDLTVTSQVSGAVMAVYCHVGDYVSSGSPIAEVVDSQTLRVTVPFPAAEAEGMTAGTAAQLSFSGHLETVTGSVLRVYDTTTTLPGGSVGTNVELEFQNPGALTSSSTATATVNGVSCMAAGDVRYAVERTLYATQTGQVLTLSLEEGTTVTTGQVVMTIDNASLTNGAENARLSAESTAVNLRLLENKRSDYHIYAPIDGTVITRSMKQGDYASAATPMATIASESAISIEVEIDELYIKQIRTGQQAVVTVNTTGGEELSLAATVYRISDTGIVSGGVTDYPVELKIDDTSELKAGMNVSVKIIIEQSADCLCIPTSAISGNTVQVLANGQPVSKAITTGISGNGYTEILTGLTEGDEVILP